MAKLPTYEEIAKKAVEKAMDEILYQGKSIREWMKTIIEQESKTGRWIDDKCSVCGKGTEDLISSHEWYRNEDPKFCPFCGVKIKEVEL